MTDRSAAMVQRLYDLMQIDHSLPAIAVLSLVLSPVTTLVHECGHALAAELRVGGAKIWLNWNRGCFTVGGRCSYDATHATRVDTVVIALAGPAMSAAFALVWWGLLARAGHTGLWHDMTWAGFLSNALDAVVNLVPMRLSRNTVGPGLRSDGKVILDAIRHRRSGSPPATPRPAGRRIRYVYGSGPVKWGTSRPNRPAGDGR